MPESPTITFIPSARLPNAADHFAQLQNDEWGHLYPDGSVARSRFDLLHNRYDESDLTTLRLAWFACDAKGTALGVAMLVGDGEVEPSDEPELPGPWFAGLIVDPSFRNQGVGSALVDFVATQARRLGFHRLRLVTEHEVEFYERRGWKQERQVMLNSVPNTVMVSTLNS